MPASPTQELVVSCRCGSVALKARAAPIVSAICYCKDCQRGSREIAALPDAAAIQDPDGGTAYVAYRKDRVTLVKGAALLKSYKIEATSATNRMVATCCNSAMLMSFDDGRHWVSMYRARFPEDAAPVQMRICTRSRTATDPLPSDVPSSPSYPFRFIVKLIAARIAMMFHS
ncbi:hypothetical protein PMI16_03614 [Herbaspirillum sp. CF444]|uniref:GFA family protein n=1 Tax=Herbaspirillum sp. CF444 TaxID=1144319 RepID=UPI000272405F|nr:hypothetical protein [Herbaspirillum sp. CF444]EJL85106.1 hypothetical protein PMI16_03614 [Herbaspirillum sp. CF444]